MGKLYSTYLLVKVTVGFLLFPVMLAVKQTVEGFKSDEDEE